MAVNEQQKEFLDEFNKKYDEKVERLIMTQIYGNVDFLKKLGLNYQPGMSELWGLFIVGKKLHFFAPASESAFMALFRASSHGKEPESQYACFSDLFSFEASLPEKKGFFAKFLYHPDIILTMKVSDSDEEFRLFSRVSEKPSEILSILSKYNK